MYLQAQGDFLPSPYSIRNKLCNEIEKKGGYGLNIHDKKIFISKFQAKEQLFDLTKSQ